MEELKENKEVDNFIELSKLGKLERDMLKDSFKIINSFKKFISNHFRLNSIQ
jgi:CBS domain-containing protein